MNIEREGADMMAWVARPRRRSMTWPGVAVTYLTYLWRSSLRERRETPKWLITAITAAAGTALVEALEARVEAMEALVEATVDLGEATVDRAEAPVVRAEVMVVRAEDPDMTMVEATAASLEETTAPAAPAGMAPVDMAPAAMVLEVATTTADASSPPLGGCCGLVFHG
ncbi:hypothetical protein NL676_022454 [Syzygium grande]|nr:hypothetical protein NL676_022454 [Syzygium grande]